MDPGFSMAEKEQMQIQEFLKWSLKKNISDTNYYSQLCMSVGDKFNIEVRRFSAFLCDFKEVTSWKRKSLTLQNTTLFITQELKGGGALESQTERK